MKRLSIDEKKISKETKAEQKGITKKLAQQKDNKQIQEIQRGKETPNNDSIPP